METTVTNQPEHKGAFACTMQGGAIYYAPDITAEKPEWREVFDLTTSNKSTDPASTYYGGGCNGGWTADQPRRPVPLPRRRGSPRQRRRPGHPAVHPHARHPEAARLRATPRSATSTRSTRSPPAARRATAPRSSTRSRHRAARTGARWTTWSSARTATTTRPTDVKRLAYSNYFVARTGLNGDHRVCMADQAADGTLTLRRGVPRRAHRRGLPRLRPRVLAARRVGSGEAALDALRHRRRRHPLTHDAHGRGLARSRPRAARLVVSGPRSPAGRRRRVRRARGDGPDGPAAHGRPVAGWAARRRAQQVLGGERGRRAADASSGCVHDGVQLHGDASRRPGPAATSSGSTAVPDRASPPGTPARRRRAGGEGRRTAEDNLVAARPRPGSDGLWAVVDLPAGSRHAAGHARPGAPGAVRRRHRRRGARTTRHCLDRAGRAGVPGPRRPACSSRGSAPAADRCPADELADADRDALARRGRTLADAGSRSSRSSRDDVGAQQGGARRRTARAPARGGSGWSTRTRHRRSATPCWCCPAGRPRPVTLAAVTRAAAAAAADPLGRHLAGAVAATPRRGRLHRRRDAAAGFDIRDDASLAVQPDPGEVPPRPGADRAPGSPAGAPGTGGHAGAAPPVRRLPRRLHARRARPRRRHETTSRGSPAAPSRPVGRPPAPPDP